MSSRGRRPNLRCLFRAVDTNNSGTIDASELQKALSNGTSRAFNKETCRLLIGLFDKDGDNEIDCYEFEALWKYVEDWTRCFKSFDKDGSGDICKGELVSALTRIGYRLSSSFYDFLFIKFDRSRSGQITFDDFMQMCIILQTLTGVFREKDNDRDGYITVHYEDFLRMIMSTRISLLN